MKILYEIFTKQIVQPSLNDITVFMMDETKLYLHNRYKMNVYIELVSGPHIVSRDGLKKTGFRTSESTPGNRC